LSLIRMESRPIVLDNGSGSIKAGFAGDLEPAVELINCASGIPEDDLRPCVMGHGVVLRWDDMVAKWRQVFKRLLGEAVPEETQSRLSQHPVLITEAPLNPIKHKELLVQHLFDEFDVPAVQVVHSGALALYSTGSRTGLVIDVGHGVAQTVPIYDSFILPHAVCRRDYGGQDLTVNLASILRKECGFCSNSAADFKVVEEIKEKLCFVAPDAKWAENNGSAKGGAQGGLNENYTLPDGTVINCHAAKLCRVPEVLFQPALKEGDEDKGIHQMARDTIFRCSNDIRKPLAANVVLSGGSMMFPGMKKRVEKELSAFQNMLNMSARATLVESPRHAAFIGGSIVASMPDLQRTFVTRAQYEDYGAAIIHDMSLSITRSGMS
ncbi:unnamed protein product, partial [Polarella glacialis]